LTNTGTVSNVTHSDTVTNQDTTTTENNTLITDTDETRSHNDDITLTKKHHDTPTGAVPTDLSIYVSSVDLDTNVSTITETNGNISTVDDDKHITGTNDMSVTDDNTLTGETTNKNTGTVTETYTHNTRGDVGVSSQMKAIQEHIDLQKTFTTIESKFFDECNDLFMQIL
jgi:hypothetical protein